MQYLFDKVGTFGEIDIFLNEHGLDDESYERCGISLGWKADPIKYKGFEIFQAEIKFGANTCRFKISDIFNDHILPYSYICILLDANILPRNGKAIISLYKTQIFVTIII